MASNKKLCITKDNRELLKIVPINDKGRVGFKILLRAKIELLFHTINYANLAYGGPVNSTDSELEFTYHTAGNGLKTSILFKPKSMTIKHSDRIVPFFNNLTEPSEKQIIPIPLCKIVCNDSSMFPEHHSKSINKKRSMVESTEYNIDHHNVAEVYMMPINISSPFDNWYNSWDLFHHIMNILPMEYYSVPTPENVSFKANSMGQGRNVISNIMDKFDDEIGFTVCSYYHYQSASPNKNYFSLFENGKYLEHLAITRLCFQNMLGVQTEVKPIYQWQLERNKTIIPFDDWNYWQEFFKKAECEYAPNLRSIIVQNTFI